MTTKQPRSRVSFENEIQNLKDKNIKLENVAELHIEVVEAKDSVIGGLEGENLELGVELDNLKSTKYTRAIELAHEALEKNDIADAFYQLDTIINANSYKTRDASIDLYHAAMENRKAGQRPTINLADSKMN